MPLPDRANLSRGDQESSVVKFIRNSQLVVGRILIDYLYYSFLRLWSILIRGNKCFQILLRNPLKICVRESVLKMNHSRLTGQRFITLRQPLTYHIQHWVIPQLIAIIHIFIATCNLKHSMFGKFNELMFHITEMSAVVDKLGYPADDPYSSFHITQKKQHSIRTYFTSNEISFNFFSTNIFKKKHLFSIIFFVKGYFLKCTFPHRYYFHLEGLEWQSGRETISTSG